MDNFELCSIPEAILINLSKFKDEETATTCKSCSFQRAENLYLLGVKTVLELCVGPSLKQLEEAYNSFGIKVTGNDIDPRWKKYYLKGNWIIGNALELPFNIISKFDAVIVAPPLSKNCSGRRLDSLSIDQVIPGYEQFFHLKNKVLVMVLPGKTLSLKNDRDQLFKLISKIENRKISIVPLKEKVTKYIDLYLEQC